MIKKRTSGMMMKRASINSKSLFSLDIVFPSEIVPSPRSLVINITDAPRCRRPYKVGGPFRPGTGQGLGHSLRSLNYFYKPWTAL